MHRDDDDEAQAHLVNSSTWALSAADLWYQAQPLQNAYNQQGPAFNRVDLLVDGSKPLSSHLYASFGL